jgi:ribosome maturation factor RimP
MRQRKQLEELISPIVDGLGLEWVGIQYFPQGKRSILRLFVEKTGGITIDDCERVSRQVNAMLSVENPLAGHYVLEVSSPGIDRILFSAKQCEGHVGKLVIIRLVVPVTGKRNFKGVLQRVEGTQIFVKISEAEEEMNFSFDDIDEIRLVPEWEGVSHGKKR